MIEPVAVVGSCLRLARLALVAFVAGTAAFGPSASALAAVAERPGLDQGPLVALGEGGRATPAARFGAVGAGRQAAVSVQLDGLRLGSLPVSGTVRDALDAHGLAVGPADRLSVAADTPLAPGMQIALDRGFPVTLIDGGRATEARSQRTTVGGLLSALSVALGQDDSVAGPLERSLAPGDVVKVVRVADREVTEIAPYPYHVRLVDDPGLESRRQVVEQPGSPGEVSETYVVRYVDGVESDRTLLSAIVLRSPVTEVRRVGTRPIVPPPAPPEIEQIIRAAALRFGADPDQLLRVAWCESRYNAYAYNPGHGDSGLFQFIPLTWAANSVRAGYGGASPFDPVASANVAAFMFARGSAGLWTCK